MNLFQEAMMDAPSYMPGWCVICGRQGVTNHHIVPRGQGGLEGPRLSLCGHGTAGHHGMAEDKKLHFRYEDWWHYLETEVSTKYERALDMPGWKPLRRLL